MSSLTKFPQSKIKEIVMADPDVKEISKQALEAMKNAAEIFAAQLFQKCFEEARKKKKTTCTINHFIEAVSKDEALNQMLQQFIIDKNALPTEEEDNDDIENVVEKISAFNSNSDDNSDDDYKQVNIEKYKDTGDSKDIDRVDNNSDENDDEVEENEENSDENEENSTENGEEANGSDNNSNENSSDDENEKIPSEKSPIDDISDISADDDTEMEADE